MCSYCQTEVNGKDKLFKMKTKRKAKTKLAVGDRACIFLNIRIIFSERLRVPSGLCWHAVYKQALHPNRSLAVKAPLFTWSVQWLLLQCAAALQHCMEQTL